jgi:hypothetical protein
MSPKDAGKAAGATDVADGFGGKLTARDQQFLLYGFQSTNSGFKLPVGTLQAKEQHMS